MKTLDKIMTEYKSETLDGRDLNRLARFIPAERLKEFGIELKEDVKPEDWNKDVLPLTKENVLIQLENDVEFGFEKALNKRGISSGMMFNVVKMWNWILEDGLEDWSDDNYAMYGLPLFKATAVKYGFENPIGDDSGTENKYNEQEY